MIELAVTTGIVALLVAMSVRADKRFRNEARLPMQWSLTGDENWTAPRQVALAFTPAIAAILLVATTILVMVSGEPRMGQKGLGPPVVLLVGLAFVGVHALHLWLIGQHLRKGSEKDR
jgi:hypothetical protein